MRVLQLTIENFCNLQAVDITPTDPHMVVIEGKNEQGKSNVINSIFWAVGGAKEDVPEPIREGADEARVTVKMGDESIELIITRRRTATRTTLEVTDAQGHVIKQPQTILSGLIRAASYDPTVFIREKGERKGMLLEICGVKDEVRQLEAERKRLYDERTAVGREVKSFKAQIDAVPLDIRGMKESDAALDPDSAIQDKIRENQVRSKAIGDANQKLNRLESDCLALNNQCAASDHDNERTALRIRQLEIELEDAKKSFAAGVQKHDEYGKQIKILRDEIEQQQKAIAAMPLPDEEGVAAALEQASASRRKAEAWRNYRKLQADFSRKSQDIGCI